MLRLNAWKMIVPTWAPVALDVIVTWGFEIVCRGQVYRGCPVGEVTEMEDVVIGVPRAAIR